jgi:YihY family inner membrane protein
MNRFLTRLDYLQRRHSWMALPFAVFKRFGEHAGGRLATAISYWGFFSIFPLLLVFVTVLNLVLEDDPDTREELVDGALGQIPVLGTDLADTQTALGGSWTTIIIGVLVALWAGLAAANALQTGLEEISDIPMFERPNAAVVRVRSIIVLVILAISLSVSTLAISAARFEGFGALTSAAGLVISLVVHTSMLLVTFKLFISGRNSLRELLPGALVAGAGIVALQAIGTFVVNRYIKGASDTYGTFAVVIALLSWFFLVSRVVLLGAELNAVLRNHVWPRSLVHSTEATDGDRRAVHLDTRRVQRDPRIGVAVSVDGDEPPEMDADPADVTTNPSPHAQ